jgi:hypothetical protein
LTRNTRYNVRIVTVCATLTSTASGSRTFRTASAGAMNQDGTVSENFDIVPLTLELSPNPARGTVNLLLEAPKEGDYNIQFNDILGKEVLLQKMHLAAGETPLSISIDKLPRGLYTVRVSVGDEMVVKKLVVE